MVFVGFQSFYIYIYKIFGILELKVTLAITLISLC